MVKMHFISKLLKLLIKFRYRVDIKWLELFDSNNTNLILPSHIALIDPVIMFAFFWNKKHLRPVVTENYYRIPILKQIFKHIWAIKVPDLTWNTCENIDTSVIVGKITRELENNHNILLYPQWSLARQWFQSIVGKKITYYVMKKAPKDTKILTVNIHWLWWSRSSRARNWKAPNLALFILKGFLFVIFNLLFFVPKRRVEIEIKDSTKLLHNAEKKWIDIFNQELEKIYNIRWEEQINYLSGLFWYNTTKNRKSPNIIKWSIKDLKRVSFNNNTQIPQGVFDQIIKIINKIKPEYLWKINLDTNLILDCFFDSLDMAELKSTVHSIFTSSSNPPLLDLKTVWDVCMMAIGESTRTEDIPECKRKYSEEDKLIYTHLKSLLKEESTILSLMKSSLRTKKSNSFCYDSIFWVQTRKDFLVKAYLIADLLKKMPWEKIAIMLPSLSATSLLVVWCYLSKKIPVMLNWTLSEEAFYHCIKSQKVEVILTAKSFFQKIQTPWLKKYKMTFFEDILKNITLNQKISALIRAAKFKIPNDISKIAVVLFTSWSEALPKAVQLTHKNILHDLLWAAGVVWIKNSDIEICYLPPFHSFGFILWIAMPLVSGTRIVFSPDPNDSKTISDIIENTKSTFLASTPTFLNWIVQISDNDQLKSLRIAIVWAEKCPKELFTKFSKKSPNATIIEWYWITECSPIISVNPFKNNMEIKRWSVWIPILWEKIKILDLETHKEQPPKKEWMIYINWLNVFEWYIDKSLESPFEEIEGKIWYKTWDLWFLDKDWYLVISWRLKRFIKIAWEMISLPAIETVLSRKWKSDDWKEIIAIQAEEKQDWSDRLVLFTTENIKKHEINDYLHSQWIRNLVSIDEIIQIKEIPILWTWKVDYVQLKWFLQHWTTKQTDKKVWKWTVKWNQKTTVKTKKEKTDKIKKKIII